VGGVGEYQPSTGVGDDNENAGLLSNDIAVLMSQLN
jgi:hypothetical protein